MDSVTAMMISLSIAGVLCGIFLGIALFQWKENRKGVKAKHSTKWVDEFLTDVRVRLGDYLLKNSVPEIPSEDFRILISTLKYPQDIRLLKKWYDYTSGLLLTLARNEGVSEPFKKYLEYVADVLCEIAVNAHVDEAQYKARVMSHRTGNYPSATASTEVAMSAQYSTIKK